MIKNFLTIASLLLLGFLSSSLYAYDSTTYGGNSPYYNSQNNNYSNYRGSNDRDYNAQDNSKSDIYGDNNSYRGSNGMIYNK